MITYIFLLICGVDLLFKIHRAFLLRTRERAAVLLVKPPGTESVKIYFQEQAFIGNTIY